MKKPITILSIDDEEEICFSLNALFKLQGWRSYTAQSVETGLALFKAYQPDIVLIDYHMPRVNGVEGVRRLRKLSTSVPILVFTIDENQSLANAFLDAGATDFALKPIKAPDLVSRINLHIRLLEQSPRESFAKGISKRTQELIENYLSVQSDYISAYAIAEGTGLAYQTVCRYLQHLMQEGRVVQDSAYGNVGRPKQLYRRNDLILRENNKINRK
ncbi:MAG: response regulator [Tenuifilaceae bacterium]